MTALRYSRQKMKVSNFIAPSIKCTALQFTSEGEENNQIPYLDVMVMRKMMKMKIAPIVVPVIASQ